MSVLVSCHAVIRYLERCQGIPIEAVRYGRTDSQLMQDLEFEYGSMAVFFKEIEDICRPAFMVGAASLATDKGTFIFENGRVVTVLAPGQRACTSGRMKRRRHRFREAAE